MNYVITSTLPYIFGGRTKSLLMRVNLLTVEYDLPFTIITTNYNPNYFLIYEKYHKNGFIPPEIELHNIYDFFRNTPKKNIRTKPEIFIKKDGSGPIKVKDRNAYKFFDSNGIYRYYKNYEGPKGSLKFIDYIREGSTERYLRREYDSEGICHREIRYLDGSLTKRDEVYFDNTGQPYLFVKSTLSGAKRKVLEISFQREGILRSFKGEFDWFRFALETIIGSGSNVICDARILDRALLEADLGKARKIFVLHSSHYDDGKMRNSYKYLLKNSSKADTVVTLTEKQREDWVREGGHSDTTMVIPHCVPRPNLKDSLFKWLTNMRSSRNIVCISRLSKEKQVDHIIKAFSQINSLHPEVKLEIYGDGDQFTELANLIEKLGLRHKCYLKGFTKEPNKVFRGALCSIVTSKFEGFCLSVMESLANGCPVISYDIKYGPNELIEHGISGLLVPQNDIGQLASAMDKVLSGHKFNVKLKGQYYSDCFNRKWQSLLVS